MTADYAPTDLDAADQRQTDQTQAAEQKLAEEAADWRELMTSAAGRRIMWALLVKAGVYKSSYSPDAMAMAFKEGERNQGLYIVAKIGEHAPAMYELMKQEAR